MNDLPTIGTESRRRRTRNGTFGPFPLYRRIIPLVSGGKWRFSSAAALDCLGCCLHIPVCVHTRAEAQPPDLEKAANEPVTVDVIHVKKGVAQEEPSLCPGSQGVP